MIPTDFTIESLNLVKHAMENNPSRDVRILFVCGLYLPTSITELLFYSQSDTLKKMIGPEFSEACKIIRNKYQSRLSSIDTAGFNGSTVSSFRSFVKGNEIHEAYIPKKYKLKNPHPYIFDCTSWIRWSKLPVHEVDWTERPYVPEKDLLAELFIS